MAPVRHSRIALTRLYGLVKVNPVLDGFCGFIKATDKEGFHIVYVADGETPATYSTVYTLRKISLVVPLEPYQKRSLKKPLLFKEPL